MRWAIARKRRTLTPSLQLELVTRHLDEATSKQAKIEEEEECMIKKVRTGTRPIITQ